MRIVYFGSGEFAVPALRWLVNSPHRIAGVVTQPDRPAGRGKRVVSTPVASLAEREGLLVLRCEDVNSPALVDQIGEWRADLGVVAAFGQKMNCPLRSVFAGECVNIHASLLPKYRGAAPIAHAVLNAETRTGVTTFRLVDHMDAGPILVQRETSIGSTETSGELHDRLAGIGCDALDATLKLLEKDLHCPGQPQDEARVTQAPKLAKSDGYLRFDEPAERLAARCRAMCPWPGARCRFVGDAGDGVEVTITTATAIPAPVEHEPGTITPILAVATGSGALEIHGIKPAGKREMSWQDFVNGRHVQPGHRFESLMQ